MDRIDELLANIAALTADELTELDNLITEAATQVEGDSPEEVVVLNKLADAREAARTRLGEVQAANEQAKADAIAARQRLNGETEETPAEEPVAEADLPAEEAVEEEAPAEQEAVTAAGGSRIRRMAAAAGRPTPSPEAAEPRHGAVLTASGALANVGIDRIDDPDQLGEGISRLLQSMSKADAPRGKVLVASAQWEYPDDRKLSRSDPAHNERVFQRVIGRRPFLSLPAAALVASGGTCSPVNVDYSVPGWSTADRPLRDGLPAFQADRGGITYVPPGDIATYSGATSIWTEATDANPAGATKPVVQVVCGSPVTVLVDAVPTRLGFGNMTARFAPEQTAANVDLALSEAARIAENNLLQKIAASCVADVTSATLLGATRDFITVIHQVVAGYRSLHRIPESVKFTAIFPSWVRDMIIVDRAREIGHGEDQNLNFTYAQVDDLLSAHGVNPLWHLDGQSAAQLSGAGSTAQIFAAQSASGAVNPFPTKIVWYVFPEGAFQFLDSGRLDLGVVRDSTLDATNDYETFVETFEGVAFRGFSSGAFQMVSTTGALGGTAGTISTAGSPA